MKKMIMYGAGNIGRGFIGQVFSDAGYSVGFIDINKEVISRLNADGEYPVDVVSSDGTEEQTVKNVYGIDGSDAEKVADEICSADIMATAIGVNVLKFIAKPLSLGLKKRFDSDRPPFNIIICENLIGADKYLKGLIKEQIPEYSERVDKEIGFVEASIGRMVPVVTEEKKAGNPLRVFVEPYNILPVDKAAFKGEIPKIKNLYPYAPFDLFIQRKLFMHNMSHAVCAYLGNLKGYEYIYQAAGDAEIKYAAFRALAQSAVAVAKENDADVGALVAHAENLLYRFTNVALGDTVERVGRDTMRKLGGNDRLVGAVKLAEKYGLPCEFICLGAAAAMRFAPAGDEKSAEIKAYAEKNGAKKTLEKYSEYNGKYADFTEEIYNMMKANVGISEIIVRCESENGKKIIV